MSAAEERASVCVLGMHRSGTSLVARCLNLLGVSLGREERLMRAEEDNNPAGFWEHVGFVAINNRILERAGGSWHEPPELSAGWETSDSLSDLRARARELVAREFESAPRWGFKDPRCSLTLPFWRDVIPGLRAVVCVRNPLEVAASLHARDGFTEEKAIRLWMDYTLGALRHTSELPRLVTFYESYFEDWRLELGRLAAAVASEVPAAGSDRHREIESFLDAKLRHQRSPFLEGLERDVVDLPAKSLYFTLWLLHSCLPRLDAEPPPEAKRASDVLFRAIESYGDAREYRALRRALEQKSDRLTEREARIRHLEARLDTIESVAAERERDIHALLGSRSWRLTAPLRRMLGWIQKG